MTAGNNRGLSLCIIAVRYYLTSDRFEKEIIKVRRTFGKKFETINLLAYDLNGAVPSPGPREFPVSKVVGHWLDMSGFKMSISEQPDSDAYLYLNDTLFTKHPAGFLIDRLSSLSPLIASLDNVAIGGEINPSTDVIFDELNQRVSRHASTYCFLLNNSGNKILGDILKNLPNDNSYDCWIESNNTMYPRLKTILDICINSPENPWSWIGRSVSSSPQLLKRKSVTIAVEHILSARIIMEGGCLVPINYGFMSKLKRWSHGLSVRLRALFI